MPRLIDENRTCRIIEQQFCGNCHDDCENCPYNDVLKLLRNQPTVDAVRVVRCKECKWRIGLRCYHKRSSMDDLVGENDYCAWGERKDE